MITRPIEIKWHPGLPVFASDRFLSAVGDEYGWLGGFDEAETLRCILPYTIVRRLVLSMVRFRVETIYLSPELSVAEERAFLNGAVQHFRDCGHDIIIPATTNAIFRTYPDGADAAPYGSYIIDLRPSQDELWKKIGRITRQNIGSAQKEGVRITEGLQFLERAYPMIRDTFRRSQLPFMSYQSFERFAHGLGANGKLLVALCGDDIHSCVLFGFSGPAAYAIYAGNLPGQQQGANKLIYWEAIRQFKGLGCARFDFVGARINPEKGSKQEGINLFKQRFGATLVQGYIWKFPLRRWTALAYSLASRWLKGGDIVEHERHKLADLRSTDGRTAPEARCIG
jgi:hypothetical protein